MKDYEVGVSSQRKGKSIFIEKRIEIVDITTPQEESIPTFKRLKIKLKETRDEVDKMIKEYLHVRRKFKEVLDIHCKSIGKENSMAKRFLPLHRKLINIYRKNIYYQSQIKNLKEELWPFKEELANRNMNTLPKFATRRSSRVKKLKKLNLLKQYQFLESFMFMHCLKF
jgi:hypothetical protein